MIARRPLLLALGAPLAARAASAAGARDGAGAAGPTPSEPTPLRPRPLHFPRDHGAHPDTRIEWWYLTGALQAEGGGDLGFQLTFFRSRVDAAQSLRSAFAARQLISAHAALTEVSANRLWHAQEVARQGFGVAEADPADSALRLRRWQLHRESPTGGPARYVARMGSADFSLDLRAETTQPLLLQGEAGWSRKGPDPGQASHYYSQPQLAVSGRVMQRGRWRGVRGRAWLDHEWSETLLHPDAAGWDWIGMNLDDGSALTAFRLRRRDGTPLWSGGSWRAAGQPVRPFAEGPTSLRFEPLRHWTSPTSGARYPVVWQVHTPAGRFEVRARIDAQELDASATTGTIYWEGLSELRDGPGRRIGSGYLEMTGYARPMRL